MVKLDELIARFRKKITAFESDKKNYSKVGKEQSLRLNNGEHNNLLDSLRNHIAQMRIKQQQKVAKNNEKPNKSYADKKSHMNELISKLRNSKKLNISTGKTSSSTKKRPSNKNSL